MKYLFFLLIVMNGFAQNAALNFDGVNDFMEVSNGLEGFGLNKDFTLSFWLKVPASSNDSIAMSSEGLLAYNSNQTVPFQVTIATQNQSKKLEFTRSDGIASPSMSTSVRVDDRKWHYVTIVKLKKLLFLYVDGELDAFVKDNTDFKGDAFSGLTIGKGRRFFKGSIDELRLRNVAFSDTEVLEDMIKPFSYDENLILAFDFNEGNPNTNNENLEPVCDDLVSDNIGVLNGFNLSDSTSNWVTGAPIALLQSESTSWFGELGNAIENMRNGDPVNLQLSWFLKGLAGVCLFIFVIYLAVNWEMNRRKRRALEKEQQLNKELGKKKNELLSQSLHLAKKNEVINDINSELKEISKGVNTSNEKLNTILKTLRFEQNAEQDWEIFKTQFNEVHKGFDAKLKAISPEVTNMDIKLTAFLRMKMTNKEIANILNVQPMSVKKSKFRLRKKLKMNPEEFEAFLAEL